MARGAPDYSNTRVSGLVTRLDDMAELAIRLGGVSSIDRTGSVVHIETFESGLSNVTLSDSGAGETSEMSPLFAHYGDFCLRLARVADTGSWAGFTSRAAARAKGKVGAEVLFNVMTGLSTVKLYFIHHDGDSATRFGLRWDGSTKKVYIGGDTEGWEEADETFSMLMNYPIKHSMKIVGDVENDEYVRAYIDGNMITLPDKDPYPLTSDQAANLALTFYNAIGPITANTIYCDAAIITQNEP